MSGHAHVAVIIGGVALSADVFAGADSNRRGCVRVTVRQGIGREIPLTLSAAAARQLVNVLNFAIERADYHANCAACGE